MVSPREPSRQRHEVLMERAATSSPAAANVLKPHLYRDALARVAPLQTAKRAAAALVIPDYAVRMAIIDLEQFPPGEADRLALLRFRLRKTVPFHIDEAQLSYAIQLNEPGQLEVLTVAVARPILDEYEHLLTTSGYRVGLVTPSSVAALPLCYGAGLGLTLVAKAAGSILTVLLLEGTRVRLVRCVNLSGDGSEGATSGRDEQTILPLLQQTLAYAEDQLKKPAFRLLLCGFGTDTDALGTLAQREFGVSYGPLRSKYGAASQANTGLLGLLEQYAA